MKEFEEVLKWLSISGEFWLSMNGYWNGEGYTFIDMYVQDSGNDYNVAEKTNLELKFESLDQAYKYFSGLKNVTRVEFTIADFFRK
jgi:hypothetical protein